MFCVKHAEAKGRLTKGGLGRIMRELNHPENERELTESIHQWGENGLLDFQGYEKGKT
jgi:hypothetical protein